MSNVPSPSKIAAARIPKITDLREQLEYGDGKLARSAAFIDDLRIFRRRYQCSGLRGIDLWDWKSPQHQHALRQMTADFLDGEGYGEVYWPSDPTAANFNSLRYASDRTFITHTMRQLIFRLNLQQHRNEKYKRKTTREVIEIDDEDESHLFCEQRGSDIEHSSTSPTMDSNVQVQARAIVEHSKARPNNPRPMHQESDMSHMSTSPEAIVEPNTSKRKSEEPSRNDERGRSKVIRLKLGTGTSLNPTLRPIAPMYKRTSPRTKRTAAPVNYADIVDLDQPFSSPRSATESTLGFENYGGAGYQNHSATQQQAHPDDDNTNRININEFPVPSEGVSLESSAVLQGTTIDSNIDPSLERISSTSSLMDSSSQENIVEFDRAERALISASPSQLDPNAQKELYKMFAMDSRAQHLPMNVNGGVEPTSPAFHTVSTTPSPPRPLVPPNDAKEVARTATQPVATNTSRSQAAPSAEPKTGISFNYRVVLSRTPIYRSKSWDPKGRFLKKSLSELIDELPFENKAGVVGLVIELTGPGTAVEEKITRGMDERFDEIKGHFLEIVKMCLQNHNQSAKGGGLVMSFKIEALREDNAGENEQNDDELIIF